MDRSSSLGLRIGDLVAQTGVLSRNGSGGGRSSVSLTHDLAVIIPGVRETAGATVTKIGLVTGNSPDISGNLLQLVTQIQAQKLLCTCCINICTGGCKFLLSHNTMGTATVVLTVLTQ